MTNKKKQSLLLFRLSQMHFSNSCMRWCAYSQYYFQIKTIPYGGMEKLCLVFSKTKNQKNGYGEVFKPSEAFEFLNYQLWSIRMLITHKV